MELAIGTVVMVLCVWFVLGIEIRFNGERSINNATYVGFELTPAMIMIIIAFIL